LAKKIFSEKGNTPQDPATRPVNCKKFHKQVTVGTCRQCLQFEDEGIYFLKKLHYIECRA
jgi:hypothetical protein